MTMSLGNEENDEELEEGNLEHDEGENIDPATGKSLEVEEAEEWTPPTKAEYTKLQRQAKRAASDLEKLKKSPKAEVNEDDVDKAKQAVRDEESAKYKARIVKSEAKGKLLAAGAEGDVTRLIKMIDLDDVEVDDDGEIDGLDDQIDELKEGFPQLFATGGKKTPKADPRTRDGAADRTPPKKAESSAEKIARLMMSGQPS